MKISRPRIGFDEIQMDWISDQCNKRGITITALLNELVDREMQTPIYSRGGNTDSEAGKKEIIPKR